MEKKSSSTGSELDESSQHRLASKNGTSPAPTGIVRMTASPPMILTSSHPLMSGNTPYQTVLVIDGTKEPSSESHDVSSGVESSSPMSASVVASLMSVLEIVHSNVDSRGIAEPGALTGWKFR